MFKLRKIASVLASTLMLGSTVGLAAAANKFPAPFVSNGQANVALVYGTAGAQTDIAAVAKITETLSAELAKQVAKSGTGSTSAPTGGDFVKFDKGDGNDRLNLGSTITSVYDSLTVDELSNVLADGTYKNDDNDEYEFTQEISTAASILNVIQDSDLNDEKPTIGLDLQSGDPILNYTLDFDTSVDGGTAFVNLKNTDLTLLGKKYYVLDVANSTGTLKLTLLDSASTSYVSEGESTTVEIGDKKYDVSINFVSSNQAVLEINGKTTDKLAAGETYKLDDNTYVGIKDILVQDYAGGTKKVEFSIGSGKIVIENGAEVTVNGDRISKDSDYVINSYFTTTGATDLDSITLEWLSDKDMWVAPGSEVIMPGFNAVKLSTTGFVWPEAEKTTITNDGSGSLKLATEIKDGPVSFNLLYTNETGGFEGIGKSSSKKLYTSSTSQINITDIDNAVFVATYVSGDNSESYLFEVVSVDTTTTKNTTVLRNLADNKETSLNLGNSKSIGKISFTLDRANEDDLVVLSTDTSGANFDRLVTKQGLRVMLPVDGSGSTVVMDNANAINFTLAPATHKLAFIEADKDGNIADTDAKAFSVTLGHNSDLDVQVSAVAKGNFTNGVNYETEDGSEDYIGYVNSTQATQVLHKTGGDQDSVEITYSGKEAYGEVYLSQVGTTMSTGNGTTTLGSISVPDTQVSSVSSKNLIVVGGSCVNTFASTLLGSSTPVCGADFTAKTNVGAGQFLIQTFEQTGGKVATLVAGFNAEDTTKAADYFRTSNVTTDKGTKYIGTSATSAEMVTTA